MVDFGNNIWSKWRQTHQNGSPKLSTNLPSSCQEKVKRLVIESFSKYPNVCYAKSIVRVHY